MFYFPFLSSNLWSPICICIPLSEQGVTSSREAPQTFWATKGTHPVFTLWCPMGFHVESLSFSSYQLLVMPCQKYLACTFVSFLPGYLLTCHKTVTPISKENTCPREQDYLLIEQAQLLKGWVIPMLALATGCQACFSICRERRFLRSTRLHSKGLFCLFIFFTNLPGLKEKIFVIFFMDSYIHMLYLWSFKLLV